MEVINLFQFPFEGNEIPNSNGDVFTAEAVQKAVQCYLPKSVTVRRSEIPTELPDQTHEHYFLFPVQSGNRRRPMKVDPLVRRIRAYVGSDSFPFLEEASRLLELAMKGEDDAFWLGLVTWNWLHRVILYQTLSDISPYPGNYELDAGKWGTTLLRHADRVMQFLDVLEVPSGLGLSCALPRYAMGQLDAELTSMLLLADEERGYFAFPPSEAVLSPRPMPVPEKTLYRPSTLTYALKRKLWDALPKDKDTGIPVDSSKEAPELFFTSDDLLRSRTRDVTWLGHSSKNCGRRQRTAHTLVSSKPSDADILGVEEDVDFYSDSSKDLFPRRYEDSIFSEREEMERYAKLRQLSLHRIRDTFLRYQDRLPLPHFCGVHTKRNAVEVYCWMRDPDMVSVDSGSAFILCNRIARIFRTQGIRIRIYRFRERLRNIEDGHQEQLMNPSIPWRVPGTFLVKLELPVARKEAINRIEEIDRTIHKNYEQEAQANQTCDVPQKGH